MHLKQYLQTKTALGGDVSLTLVTDAKPDSVEELYRSLWRLIHTFESQFSRFLPKSELSVFNRHAGLKNRVSPEFKELLAAAKRMGDMTSGLYNPFILPALQRTGYLKSATPGYEDDATDDFSHRAIVSLDELTVGDDWASIPFNTALDMGGSGKGYLADQLRAVLAAQNLSGYLLSFSGDIATYGLDQDGNAWTVYIQDAANLSGHHSLAIACPTKPFAVATSGTFRRGTQLGGRNWHHLIDPVTLEPAKTDVLLATVCTESTLEADVLASCAAILGSQRAPEFLSSRAVKAMLLQCQDETGSFDAQFDYSSGKSLLKTFELEANLG